MYVLANVFVQSVYWYLFPRRGSRKYFGRFMSAFRIVGLFPADFESGDYAIIETQTGRYIYMQRCSIFFGFGLMCLMVKEGISATQLRDSTNTIFQRIWHEIKPFASSVSCIRYSSCITPPRP